MRIRRFSALPVALAAGVLAAFSLLGVATASDDGQSDKTFVANLNGANEAPGPGEEEGWGKAWITVNERARRVCWVITSQGTDTPFAAHVHWAPRGVAGPIVVPLSPPVMGSSEGCIDGIDRSLIREILDTPENFYVNTHTHEYPGGAIRGQLEYTGESPK